ncbi:MAG: type II toxin-antitoxin system PemK/MazF family toxin [Desulfamplus sp.]|nr:type II toxin-antitoxin system PemK/MazF family toxin [Desulfamplus sp.]
MGLSSKGSVVLIPFPFSDLSKSKLRPALVLASAGKKDWILCQITSQPYADSNVIELSNHDFEDGFLRKVSYIRPAKLFTANESLVVSRVGCLKHGAFVVVVNAIIAILKKT